MSRFSFSTLHTITDQTRVDKVEELHIYLQKKTKKHLVVI